MVGVHQFCKLGAHSFIGLDTIVLKDVPPYVMASGATAEPKGINSEGLIRRGFSSEQILDFKRAYKELYRKGNTLDEAVNKLEADKDHIALMKTFIESTNRGIIR